MNLSVNTLDGKTESAVLVKIVDYLGRETTAVPNTPLIYIYNDGTTKKVFNAELEWFKDIEN